ncbi:hypothetical protein ACFC0M_32555, partial [Streptomyces sp. NPDC056149]
CHSGGTAPRAATPEYLCCVPSLPRDGLTRKVRTALEEFASLWTEFADAVDRVITPDRPSARKEE